MNDPISVIDGDLLDQQVEVIVNAWNRNIIPWWLLIPQGVSGAIKKKGGTVPFREVAKHGPIIGAGSGGKKREWALELMKEELSRIETDARVILVRYKK